MFVCQNMVLNSPFVIIVFLCCLWRKKNFLQKSSMQETVDCKIQLAGLFHCFTLVQWVCVSMTLCKVIVDSASRGVKDESCKCQTSLVGRNMFPAKSLIVSCLLLQHKGGMFPAKIWLLRVSNIQQEDVTFPVDVQNVFNQKNHNHHVELC